MSIDSVPRTFDATATRELVRDTAGKVGIVGSPSTTAELTMDVVDAATHGSLLGEMVYTAHELAIDDYLLAVGTVGEIETRNRWHEDPNMRGVLRVHGTLPHLSADGDVRTATMSIQAVYRTDRSSPPFAAAPREEGGALGMSPTTGQPIYRVDQPLVDGLVARHKDSIVYLGRVYRSDVLLPMFVRDFNDRATDGAFHTGIFGRSGSGKTAFAAHLMGMQMQHPDLSMLVFDPQGQFTDKNRGLPFDLDAWARAAGRRVLKLSIASDVQLTPDAALLLELLQHTHFFPLLGMKTRNENRAALTYELETLARGLNKWTELESAAFLRELLQRLYDNDDALSRIYKGKGGKETLRNALASTLGSLEDLLGEFEPVHALFRAGRGATGNRMSIHAIIRHLIEPSNVPRPFIVIDLNSRSGVKWLDDDEVRARLMRLIASTLRRQSEEQWRATGVPVNCSVTFDEAQRYASTETGDSELARLASSLVKYVRETRKTGVGWTFITQEIKSLNPAIYAQLRVRAFGFGLTSGTDLDRLRDEVGTPGSIELYKSFPDPQSRVEKSYPFMLSGPVSPLTFTSAPVFLEVFTSEEEFRRVNHLSVLR